MKHTVLLRLLSGIIILTVMISSIQLTKVKASDVSGDMSPTPVAQDIVPTEEPDVIEDGIDAEIPTTAPIEPTIEPAEPTKVPIVTLEPTSAPIATVIPEPETDVSDLLLGDVISVKDVNQMQKTNVLDSKVPLLLVNLTSGELLAANQASEKVDTNRVSELMTVLVALRSMKADQEIKISADVVKNAAALSSPSLSGFAEGDIVTVKSLILCYMITRSDDSRLALVDAIGNSESKFVSMMNSVAGKVGMKNTKYVASDGAYNKGQYTTVYDMYLLIRELLTHELYTDNITSSSINIKYKKADGTDGKINCYNTETGYSLLYGAASLPDGLSYVARISGGFQSTGLSQFIIAKDGNGTLYLSALGRVPFEKDVAIESERLLSMILGTVYFDKDQVLPTGSDEERYYYLFGSGVQYFTVDNKPKGYGSASDAEQNMMNITVPVWQIDLNGERFSTTMPLTIHRKLVTSIRKIFNEVYNLGIQFPIKVLKGFGYRQTGGVGLSNSTLMSAHAFGSALDINPGDFDNDYYLGAGNDLRDMSNPYCIPEEVIAVFESNGWFWGGDFSICNDSMHFQYLGLDMLSYQGKSPFRDITTEGRMMLGIDIKNLQDRLTELGYNVNCDGVYSSKTKQAIIKFQKKNALEVTGVVNYKTWETIINLTHYMDYVF